MDLLKRHWEKILLTVSLLALLAAAGVLLHKIGALTEDVSTLPARFRQGKETAALNVKPYETAIERLTSPVQWTEMPVDPFKETTQEEPIKSVPTNDVVHVDKTTVTLLSVEQVAFTMIFRAYVGEGRNFQLNLQFRPKTYFVEKKDDEVKDQFGNTGYFVSKFEKKVAKVKDASLGGVEREVDVSELTLQHKGEEPIVLVLGKPARHGEPVATVECSRGTRAIARTQIRRGQYFRCGQTTYNVVDIKADEMVIKDAQKPEEKPVTIKLKSATPVNQEEGAAGEANEPGNQNQ